MIGIAIRGRKSLTLYKGAIFKAVLLTLCFSAFLPIGGRANQNEITIKATVPDQQHKDWQAAQRSSALDTESKIKSTIDAFFIIKYESWVRGELLDFGFLFDQTDPQGQENYQYELGVMHYQLAGYKAWDILLARYEYLPTFYKLSIEENKARVMMRPTGDVFLRRRPNNPEYSAWTDYVFSLESVEGCWLVKSVSCGDPDHKQFPHGTDFAQLAVSLTDTIKAQIAEANAKDLTRRKGSLSPQSESPRTLTYFDKISGFYEGVNKQDGSRLTLLILVEEGIPFVYGPDHLRAELRQIEGKPGEFSFIAKDGETCYLTFLEDNKGEIARSVLKKGELTIETYKNKRLHLR